MMRYIGRRAAASPATGYPPLGAESMIGFRAGHVMIAGSSESLGANDTCGNLGLLLETWVPARHLQMAPGASESESTKHKTRHLPKFEASTAAVKQVEETNCSCSPLATRNPKP